MKDSYEKLGLDKENPGMYKMICWMTDEFQKEEGDGYDFDEFIEKSTEYFS